MGLSKPFAMGMFLATCASFGIIGAYVRAEEDSHDSTHELVFGHAALYSMEEGISNIIAIVMGEEEHEDSHEEDSHEEHDSHEEEDAMSFMLVPATTATEEGLEEAEETAEAGNNTKTFFAPFFSCSVDFRIL